VSPAAVSVRRASATDAEVVGSLTERAYRVDDHLAFDDGSYAAELADGARRIAEAEVLVAEQDGVVVGTVTVVRPGTPYAETSDDDELEVRMLAVDPDVRRSGAGRALMLAVLELAAGEGFRAVVLSTQVRMAPAHRLYEGLGFERLPERDWTVAGVDLLCYRRVLGRP
jgi:ribosomal protein S18 acetylase RimI-like enzyme